MKQNSSIKVNTVISTSNHMFGRAIWDKLSECIFENFEIARVKREKVFSSVKTKANPHFAVKLDVRSNHSLSKTISKFSKITKMIHSKNRPNEA